MIGGNGIEPMTKDDDKWNRAVDLFAESVYKPDNELRQCARNQDCYEQLMYVRQIILDYISILRK